MVSDFIKECIKMDNIVRVDSLDYFIKGLTLLYDVNKLRHFTNRLIGIPMRLMDDEIRITRNISIIYDKPETDSTRHCTFKILEKDPQFKRYSRRTLQDLELSGVIDYWENSIATFEFSLSTDYDMSIVLEFNTSNIKFLHNLHGARSEYYETDYLKSKFDKDEIKQLELMRGALLHLYTIINR